MPLDNETLERLLIDRGLGVNSGDVDSLLSAYLEFDQEATSVARRINATVQLARSALSQGEKLNSHELRSLAANVHAARRSLRQRRIVRNVLSLAACAILGLCLGAFLFRKAPSIESAAIPIRAVQPVVKVVGAGPSENTSSFWSVRRIYEKWLREKPRQSPHLVWESPLKPSWKGDQI